MASNRLCDHLEAGLIRVPLAARVKIDAITELVDLIHENNQTNDRQRLLDAVIARERQRTTAIGRGLALPHAKTDACERMVIAIGRTAEPIDFEAIDGQPVRLIVLLASPVAQAGLQIQMLARLSRLALNDEALTRLLAAGTAEELIEVVRTYEAG
jgi:mannitol/fructose-specific phosphotransferase system IIA component (Ntr-type)